MSLLVMHNLAMGATEVGAGPVGPGIGRELMLVWIGRCVIWGLTQSWVLYGGGLG